MNDEILDLEFRARRGQEENPSFAGRQPGIDPSVLPTVFTEPNPGTIWGVDTSHWDGNVDFSVTAAAGGRFAFIKCIDGTVPTPYFLENFGRAVGAGLLASGYAWLYPDRVVSAALQARRLAEVHDRVAMTMPAVIDFEWTRYAGEWANPNFDDLGKWATEYNRLTGRKAILYSAAGFMNDFGMMPADLREMFFGFWWASYGGAAPLLPRGFTTWDCWQFSAQGDALKLAPGDKGKLELDLNQMKPEFFERLGGTLEPLPQPVPGGNMQYKVVWSSGVARRPSPSTRLSSGLTGYSLGQIVEVVEDGIPDADDPTNTNKRWVKFPDGLYGASNYPRTDGTPAVRMEKVADPAPVPAKEPFTLTVQGFKPFSGELEKL